MIQSCRPIQFKLPVPELALRSLCIYLTSSLCQTPNRKRVCWYAECPTHDTPPCIAIDKVVSLQNSTLAGAVAGTAELLVMQVNDFFSRTPQL